MEMPLIPADMRGYKNSLQNSPLKSPLKAIQGEKEF